jgi:hypothetical protein
MTISSIEPAIAISEDDGSNSYVDWPAIFGGAVIAVASVLLLSAVGVALGLAVVSPWTANPSPTKIGLAGAAWFALTTLYAAAVGGYVVGRLRKPVLDSTDDERSNRDGLNGLIAWGVGLIASALLTGMVLVTAANKTVDVAATVAGPVLSEGIKSTANQASTFVSYYVDRALRPAANSTTAPPATTNDDPRPQLAAILAHGLASGTLAEDDRAYLQRVVAQRAGVSDAEAKARVDQMISDANDAYAKTVTAAKEAADTARKVFASVTSWFAIVSLLAAMLSWYAAIIGGRHRDQKILV